MYSLSLDRVWSIFNLVIHLNSMGQSYFSAILLNTEDRVVNRCFLFLWICEEDKSLY